MANKEFVVETKVSKERIVDMFIGACEGGSNYWCKELTPKGKGDAYEAMLNGFSLIDLENGKKHLVTKVMIEKGLQLMANNYAYHFSSIVGETDDAETADIFLQCCVFGEVIYG